MMCVKRVHAVKGIRRKAHNNYTLFLKNYQFLHSTSNHLPSIFKNGFHPKMALWKTPYHISNPPLSFTAWPVGGEKNERPTCTNLTQYQTLLPLQS